MNAAAAKAHPSRLPEDAVAPVDGLHDSNTDDFWPANDPPRYYCDHGIRRGSGHCGDCELERNTR